MCATGLRIRFWCVCLTALRRAYRRVAQGRTCTTVVLFPGSRGGETAARLALLIRIRSAISMKFYHVCLLHSTQWPNSCVLHIRLAPLVRRGNRLNGHPSSTRACTCRSRPMRRYARSRLRSVSKSTTSCWRGSIWHCDGVAMRRLRASRRAKSDRARCTSRRGDQRPRLVRLCARE